MRYRADILPLTTLVCLDLDGHRADIYRLKVGPAGSQPIHPQAACLGHRN